MDHLVRLSVHGAIVMTNGTDRLDSIDSCKLGISRSWLTGIIEVRHILQRSMVEQRYAAR